MASLPVRSNSLRLLGSCVRDRVAVKRALDVARARPPRGRPPSLPVRSRAYRVDLRVIDRYHLGKPMETVTLSSKYQLVLPRGARERLKLRPGMRITVLDKGGVLFLVPERPVRAYRGIARGVNAKGLREKKDRL